MIPTPRLRTERLFLKPLTVDDIPAYTDSSEACPMNAQDQQNEPSALVTIRSFA